MSYNFSQYEPEQMSLLPPSLMEWVREESLARCVSQRWSTSWEGRLAAFYARCRADGWGQAAYAPRMMVKVLLYAYCTGVVSSRLMAQALEG